MAGLFRKLFRGIWRALVGKPAVRISTTTETVANAPLAQPVVVAAVVEAAPASAATAPVAQNFMLAARIYSAQKLNKPSSRAKPGSPRGNRPKAVEPKAAVKRSPPRKHVWLATRPSPARTATDNVVRLPERADYRLPETKVA